MYDTHSYIHKPTKILLLDRDVTGQQAVTSKEQDQIKQKLLEHIWILLQVTPDDEIGRTGPCSALVAVRGSLEPLRPATK